jgi:hypothetical protein
MNRIKCGGKVFPLFALRHKPRTIIQELALRSPVVPTMEQQISWKSFKRETEMSEHSSFFTTTDDGYETWSMYKQQQEDEKDRRQPPPWNAQNLWEI